MLWGNGAPLRLRNPVGEDQAFLRTSLLPGLIAALERNIRHGARSVGLYEIGRTFHAEESEERETLALSLYGETVPRSWRGDEVRDFDWHDAKGIVEALAPVPLACVRERRRLSPGFVRRSLCAGRSASECWASSRPPSPARSMPQASARRRNGSRDASKLRRHPRSTTFQSFPPVVRDIAVVCPIGLPYGDIERRDLESERRIPCQGRSRLTSTWIRREKNCPTDRKSVAISLTFRAPERTLR